MAAAALSATMFAYSPTASAASSSYSETQSFLEAMGAGWNLGNTLDATGSSTVNSETSWGNPKTTQAMIDAVKAAGFNTVRIPVSWGKHTSGDDYTIDSAWLARVKEVVDYAYDEGMYVVINVHHDNSSYYYPDSENEEESLVFLTSVWTQISEEFVDYDEHLIFETLNEPRLIGSDYEWWFNVSSPPDEVVDAVSVINTFNQEIVNTIRDSGGENETRYIMCPGYDASIDGATVSGFTLPTDPITQSNNRILLSVHAYTPYNLCLGSETDITSSSYISLTSSGKSEITSLFSKLYSNFTSQGIGVVIGETGISDKDNNSARIEWANYFYSLAKEYSIPALLWDNNVKVTTSYNENHRHLNRSTLLWSDPDVIVAIMDSMGVTDTDIPYDSSTTKLSQSLSGTTSYTKTYGDSAFTLDAKNNTSGGGSLSYSSSNTSVVTVSSAGKVTIKKKGTATITVTAAATDSYSETTMSVSITVNKKSITPTVSSISAQTYTGSAITPTVTVKDGSTTLTKTTDYVVKYSDNTNPGIATVKVTLTGNYSGSKTITFKIKPSTPTVKSTVTHTSSAVRINWNKVTGADGYKIYRYNSSTKSWVLIKTITSGSTTTYRNSGLTSATQYKYKIKAYVTDDGTTILSDYSSVISVVTRPKTPSIKSSFTCTTNAVRINWSKVSGADGYRVYRYDSTTKTYVKVKTIKSGSTTTYRDSGLSTGKTYKYKVKAYTKEGGTTTWSYVSSVKTTVTRPKTTRFTSSSKTSTAIRLNWKKVSCTGYKIQRYNSKTKSWVTIKTITSSSTTTYRISGLSKNTTYKFRIRAYKKASSVTKFGKYSSVYTVKTKS